MLRTPAMASCRVGRSGLLCRVGKNPLRGLNRSGPGNTGLVGAPPEAVPCALPAFVARIPPAVLTNVGRHGTPFGRGGGQTGNYPCPHGRISDFGNRRRGRPEPRPLALALALARG